MYTHTHTEDTRQWQATISGWWGRGVPSGHPKPWGTPSRTQWSPQVVNTPLWVQGHSPPATTHRTSTKGSTERAPDTCQTPPSPHPHLNAEQCRSICKPPSKGHQHSQRASNSGEKKHTNGYCAAYSKCFYLSGGEKSALDSMLLWSHLVNFKIRPEKIKPLPSNVTTSQNKAHVYQNTKL